MYATNSVKQYYIYDFSFYEMVWLIQNWAYKAIVRILNFVS